jgi:hypothetical protein
MPYLIDGDNLLGTWPGRKRSDAERRALALDLHRLGHRWRRRMLVVFDGSPPVESAVGAGVRFAGPGSSADDLILALLREQTDRRGWIVVTSDRSLGDQCRYLGARIERCDRFRKRMTPGPDGEKPEREEDLEYWLEAFADEQGDDTTG